MYQLVLASFRLGRTFMEHAELDTKQDLHISRLRTDVELTFA